MSVSSKVWKNELMQLPKVRDYTHVINRLKLALKNISEVHTLGSIQNLNKNYPFKKIFIGQGNSRRVLISAGIHGDEPSGIETICAFIESCKYRSYLNKWDFIFLPCINPYGFEHDIRENHDKKDLNRLFKLASPPLEVRLAKSIIESSYFNLTLELHEDSDSHGYYLFQKSNKPFGIELGYKIIESVKKIIPINLNEKIDGMPAEKGLIHRIKNIDDMEWWPMASYSLAMKSGHCFTLETPTRYPMKTRVNAHLTAIERALIEYPD